MNYVITTARLRPGLSVGWYGVPGAHGRHSTKVHVHERGRGPICGARLRADQEYQWCSWSAVEYVECGTCKRMIEASR